MIDFINIAHAAEVAAETAQEAANQSAIGSLGLNLKLFIAQLINFGIVLLVLWKWVFTPVAKKLTERTERVEKAMRDASDTEKAKNEFFQWKETEMVRVKSQATGIITAAQNEAGKAKMQILDETKKEQERVIAQAKQQIEQEKNQAIREVKSEMADLVTLASERILKKKLDDKSDKELIQGTLKELT